MPDQVVMLRGREAEKVWATFWKNALPHGQRLAKVCRENGIAVLGLGISFLKPGQAVFPLDPSKKASLLAEFERMGDEVSANFIKSDRPGRVIAFYQKGSFLLNLDLTKDPTKRESYSIEPGSLDSNRVEDPNGGTLPQRLREFDMLETKIRDLKRAEALEHGELKKLTERVAQEEVDLLETIMPGQGITFGELFLAWSKETSAPPAYEADSKVRKIIATQLTADIEGEIHKRGLDRWITDATGASEKLGTGIRVKNTNPVHALASLMASKLYNLMSEKFGLPSGRMLTVEDIENSIKEMILPPLVTPNNIEVAMMSLARFAAFTESDNSGDVGAWLKKLGKSKLAYFMTSQFEGLLELIGFGTHWREMAFARLELGHKLAAALMFTDAPESVQAPWLAWSMLLPDGLFGEVEIRRVWCLGDRPAVLLIKLGDHVGILGLHVFKEVTEVGAKLPLDPGPYNPERGEKEPATRAAFVAMGEEYEEKFRRCIPMLENLVRGACLALSDPSDWRKGDYYGKASGSEIKKASKHKELPVGERYVLGHPVQIDLREEVLDHVRTGRVGGGSPTKLFLVRGHHRQQAHGHGRLQRKTIWIEPHWKGPEDARVLLRPHQA